MSKQPTTMRDHARKVLEHQAAQAEAHEAPPDTDAPTLPDAAFVPAGVGRVVKQVTLAVLPFPVGTTYALRIMEPIRVSDVEDSKFGPARVCTVETLDGSAKRLMIVGEVLATALGRAYPKDTYSGRCFEITKLPPREGKRYADYAIAEIEGPARLAAAE